MPGIPCNSHDSRGGFHPPLRVQGDGRIKVDDILPALDGIDPDLPDGERLYRAVEANVRHTLKIIADSPEGKKRSEEGRVRFVGAIYDIGTGRVRFLPSTDLENNA